MKDGAGWNLKRTWLDLVKFRYTRSRKESSGEGFGWLVRSDLGCENQSVGKRPPGSDRLPIHDTHISLGPLLP